MLSSFVSITPGVTAGSLVIPPLNGDPAREEPCLGVTTMAAQLIPPPQTKQTTSGRTMLPVINPTVILNVMLLLYAQRYLKVF